MARTPYLTHTYREPRRITYLKEAEPGYCWIEDSYGVRVVPSDSLEWRDNDPAEDLL